MQKNAVILAAGKGTRMKSSKNKVMHSLIDRPILGYPIAALEKAGADRIVIVAGYQAQSLMDAYPQMEFALQKEQLGTGHAVMQCRMLEDEPGCTLVMNGDVPCLQPETLRRLYKAAEDHSLVLLSAVLDDGAHYGRVVRDEDGQVTAIVEAKDCDEEQKKICEINAGVYCFNNRDLFASLDRLTTDNAQHEYYLTDLVRILHDLGKSVQAIPADDPDEMAGINTVIELHSVYDWMKQKNNHRWMEQGVQIVDPSRTVIGQDVQIGKDVVIHPDTELLGTTVIGDGCEILPGTWLNNADIGEGSVLQLCKIENAAIGPHSRIELDIVKEGNGKSAC